jgi:hypothetical protein
MHTQKGLQLMIQILQRLLHHSNKGLVRSHTPRNLPRSLEENAAGDKLEDSAAQSPFISRKTPCITLKALKVTFQALRRLHVPASLARAIIDGQKPRAKVCELDGASEGNAVVFEEGHHRLDVS